MTRDETRALIERLHEIWSSGDVDAIPEVHAADFVAHMPKGWGPAESRDGHDGIRRAIERLRKGFPDWREHIEDIVIEGDKAAVRYYSTGTQLGPFGMRAATGRQLRSTSCRSSGSPAAVSPSNGASTTISPSTSSYAAKSRARPVRWRNDSAD